MAGMFLPVWMYFCFFFQAEDGIRDRNVTGVQTCALPIYVITSSRCRHSGGDPLSRGAIPLKIRLRTRSRGTGVSAGASSTRWTLRPAQPIGMPGASCIRWLRPLALPPVSPIDPSPGLLARPLPPLSQFESTCAVRIRFCGASKCQGGFETSGAGSSWTDHHREWRSMSHPDAHARAQHVAYPSSEMHGRREAAEAGPHVIVLFGATGDLARRKLLSGIGFLAVSGFTAGLRVVGTSLEELTDEEFRTFARESVEAVGARQLTDEQWAQFAPMLSYVPQSAGPEALAQQVSAMEAELGSGVRRLHYLSIPPRAASAVIETLDSAGLVPHSRVVMEKPFGEDLQSAVALNAEIHQTFREDQIFRIDHFLGKEAAQNILAFRFANGLFEPIWNRNFIDHVQVDVPEALGLDTRAAFYEPTGAYRD